MFDPVSVRLLVVTDEHTKQDNHCNLPDKADCWETDSNIGVFGHFREEKSGDDRQMPFFVIWSVAFERNTFCHKVFIVWFGGVSLHNEAAPPTKRYSTHAHTYDTKCFVC